MTNPMIALHIIGSILFAIAFDWAFQFQVQAALTMMRGSRLPTRYSFRPPWKWYLALLYLVPINVVIFENAGRFTLWVGLALVGFAVYAAAGAWSAYCAWQSAGDR